MSTRALTLALLGTLWLTLVGGACRGEPSRTDGPPPDAAYHQNGGTATAVSPANPTPFATPPSSGPEAIGDDVTPPIRTCPAEVLGPASPPVRLRETPPPAIVAAGAVVIDGGSGTVLWGRDEHVPMQPASATKIITALIAIEQGNLEEVISVDLEQRLLNRGTKMGLVTGDWFTLRDLLYGLMLPSGNDAAAVIANRFAGGEQPFAEMMNQRLCDLGLTDSVFINPSGLGRGEYSLASAYDLAQVTRAAMEYPAFRELVGARSWVARGSRTLQMRNLNELVGAFPGADGVKIGWTPAAGHTIVASATRNGHRVFVALLRTPNRAAESAALLEWAFGTFGWSR
ncbi:MAG: D-alanyl-D-alanine carboxypeptidase family protein [Dehalococcoidia bacterium]